MIALHCVSAFFQLLAAWLSFRFVAQKRLGPHWILVTVALLLMGGLRIWSIVLLPGGGDAEGEIALPVIEFSISFLLAAGFGLTERWFLLRERIESRFRAMSGVDGSMVGVLEEGRIFSRVCEELTQAGGYPLAWIGIGESDGTVRVLRSDGPEAEALSGIAIRWDDTPEGRGPTGTAIREGNPCVANRIQRDPLPPAWKAAFERHGLRSAASLPIRRKGQPALALTLYGDREDAFDRLEVEALKAMASRVETAIQSARRHEMFVCAKRAYDDLLRTQRDGVVLAREGKIVRANPSAAGMLGFRSAEEMVGRDLLDLFPAEERRDQAARMDRLAEEGRGEDPREEWIVRADGSRFSCEVAVTWVPRGNRNEDWNPLMRGPLGMILLREISQRKQVLDDLRAERDFSSKILDVAGILVLQMGPEGEILLINRQCQETTGFSPAEVLGRKAFEVLIPEKDRPEAERAFREAWGGTVSVPVEHALSGKTGEQRIVSWKYTALPDGNGGTDSLLAVGADVTERRRLERQIIAMQKLEAVGTLAGGVAHDFNNILTGILGNLDFARRSLAPDSPALAPVLESIHASERAARLVRQLLEFSRRSPVEWASVDVGAVIREVVQLFSQTIDRRIGVEVSVPEGLWNAAADSGQLHQVLMNLCVNARDAVMERMASKEEGAGASVGGRIRISAGNETIDAEYCRSFPYARPGEFVRLSVADDGIGMDEETQRRVFEPFFTTKKMGRGTGLGLSTVFGIVKQHAGWITLESRKEAGSVFGVYIPRATGPEKPEEPAPVPSGSTRGKETILLADDEEMIRDLGRQILEMQGYTVITAADGQEAIDRYIRDRSRIDLVLLDMTMPHLSGVEVMERIRELDPGAKILLSSGYRADAGDAERKVSKASAFLPKPYRPDLLAKTVREVLDRSGR
ncbi:MAG: hypothetical protein Kow00128_02620 [Deltaproteobacteria bacterium]